MTYNSQLADSIQEHTEKVRCISIFIVLLIYFLSIQFHIVIKSD